MFISLENFGFNQNYLQGKKEFLFLLTHCYIQKSLLIYKYIHN